MKRLLTTAAALAAMSGGALAQSAPLVSPLPEVKPIVAPVGPVTLADIVAQTVGTANAAGLNPITLDPETRAKASICGQLLTSAVAGFGCYDAAQGVADAFNIVLTAEGGQ